METPPKEPPDEPPDDPPLEPPLDPPELPDEIITKPPEEPPDDPPLDPPLEPPDEPPLDPPSFPNRSRARVDRQSVAINRLASAVVMISFRLRNVFMSNSGPVVVNREAVPDPCVSSQGRVALMPVAEETPVLLFVAATAGDRSDCVSWRTATQTMPPVISN